MTTGVASPGARLRELIRRPRPVLLPGAGSALEARVLAESGFEAVYVSGYATAATLHGLPDIGLISADAMTANVRSIAARCSVPVVADADTGYGDVVNVRACVRALEAAGAGGIQIEDQTWPKRCGHLEGKKVESVEVMVAKIESALMGRADPDTVIIARTDARGPLGLAEATRRAAIYSAVGADVTFVDAPDSYDELVAVGAGHAGPKLVNMSEGGKTPILPLHEFEKLGFDIVLYPTSMLRVGLRAMREFAAALLRDGDSLAWSARIADLDEMNAAVGMADEREFEDAVTASAGRKLGALQATGAGG